MRVTLLHLVLINTPFKINMFDKDMEDHLSMRSFMDKTSVPILGGDNLFEYPLTIYSVRAGEGTVKMSTPIIIVYRCQN